jgi:hypothetical protein
VSRNSALGPNHAEREVALDFAGVDAARSDRVKDLWHREESGVRHLVGMLRRDEHWRCSLSKRPASEANKSPRAGRWSRRLRAKSRQGLSRFSNRQLLMLG